MDGDDYYYDDYTGSTGVDDNQWLDNRDGSWTNLQDSSIWQNDVLIGYENGDGSWTDNFGMIYSADNELIGAWREDGTWYDLEGNLYDENDNRIGFIPQDVATDPLPTPGYGNPSGGGFWSGVGNFLSNIFGGSGQPGAGGPGSGGNFGSGSFGSGSSGQQQAQQQAQRAQQQLAQAMQGGASQNTIANLQRQLAAAQQLLARAGGTGADLKPFLIAGAVGLGVYILAQRQRR